MRAGEDRDPDRVGVLLDRGLDDLLGRLVQAGVDDLHPRVTQRACDDLGAPVVPVETGLCYDDANLAGHRHEYMSVKLTVVGCSPAWPNPGGAQSGYLLEGPGRLLLDCGPGVLGEAARARGLATGRRDRDHALAPRPLGRPRPLGLGLDARPRRGRRAAGALGPARGPRAALLDRRPARPARDVRGGVPTCTSTPTASPSTAAGFEVTAHRVVALRAARVRLPRLRERDGRRLLRRLGPERQPRRDRARPTCSSARRRCSRRTPRAARAAT